LLALPNNHLVAECDGAFVAGYALAFDRDVSYDGEEFLEFRRSVPEPYIYIDQVAVSKETRNLGIGSALYAALESLAKPNGTRQLCCEVNTSPPNPESSAFHRKLGFHPIGSLATRDGRLVELLTKQLR
jgi:predicted GNAT superfamily acetyltransferase